MKPANSTPSSCWVDGDGNKHEIVTTFYGGGRFICKKLVNGIVEQPQSAEEGPRKQQRPDLEALDRLVKFRSAVRNVCLGDKDDAHELSSRKRGGRGADSDDTLVVCRSVIKRLNDPGFKDSVIKELRDLMFDAAFIDRLDTRRELLAFSNGVWDVVEGRFRAATREDCLSLDVGYAYTETDAPEDAELVEAYWRTLHPDPEQREYVQRMFARQLHGDDGMNLFHVHTGRSASAANGKSKFFEVLERCLGSYVAKFGVEHIVTTKRPEPGKPMPGYDRWRGRRILYCTEPNDSDKLHSGILKDLTGGEAIVYRMLFSNDERSFRPQFKLHMMCNDAPNIDGRDAGVQRRVRMIQYTSRFVQAEDADPANHVYAIDGRLATAFDAPGARMAFLRSLLAVYRHGWQFSMPAAIRESSNVYLEENNVVAQFVQAHVKRASHNTFFTLSAAREMLFDNFNVKSKTLKTDLERALGCTCTAQLWADGKNNKNAFVGWTLVNTVDDAVACL
jgi:phage/plasmid-associated DNA primase